MKKWLNYKIIRLIHLYAGLIILSFLLMYAITGLRFFHEEYFNNDIWTDWEMHQDVLKSEITGSIDDYAYTLKEDFGFVGRVKPVEVDVENHRTNFNFESSTTQNAIDIYDELDSVEVWSRTNTSLRHKMNYLHVTRGYGGGFLYTLYAIFVDLTIISLFLFIVTGLFMWWKAYRKDVFGWILLIAGLFITFGQVIYFMNV